MLCHGLAQSSIDVSVVRDSRLALGELLEMGDNIFIQKNRDRNFSYPTRQYIFPRLCKVKAEFRLNLRFGQIVCWLFIFAGFVRHKVAPLTWWLCARE